MQIPRDRYLQRLIDRQGDGLVKAITGLRRCGKSYLLNVLYRDWLERNGVPASNILVVPLDQLSWVALRNPFALVHHVRKAMGTSKDDYFLFIDEIQMSDVVPNPTNSSGAAITFYDALNDLRSLPNLDIYVTGSNSKMLSTDILTNFRGRADEIRMHPLSFAEFLPTASNGRDAAFEDFAVYGGMPECVDRRDPADKTRYLRSLFSKVYFTDIIERHQLKRPDVLERLTDLLCSNIGGLTNPSKLTRTLASKDRTPVSDNTVRSYLSLLEDTFLFERSRRFDLKGKAYLDHPCKYYSEDLGLRNARLEFRQIEMPHIVENIVYNELRLRGFSVDVGSVVRNEQNKKGNTVRRTHEVDFVVRSGGGQQTYVQCAWMIPDSEKYAAETRSLLAIPDAFPKLLVRGDIIGRWHDNNGILNINIKDFLLDDEIIHSR